MSDGLRDLLSDLVTRRQSHEQMVQDGLADLSDNSWKWHDCQVVRLDNQIERVLNLLERD